jgi:DNA-binding CsgD family transcriptional regulator/predicted negative regulator of RcsB-dependent stress response
VLIGRESECARLEEVLDGARTGRSGALVLRGEAGIGKTALLEHAIGRAEGMTVVRALGVESEAELQFSALLEVCWPLRDHLEEISDHQAEVLRAALGLGPAESHDRFSVGAATLTLLAAAGESNPLFVVVDDAQWVDRSSQDALLFALRRLEADRVALLLAAREGEERAFEAPGVESISVTGVPREAAISLLRKGGQAEVAPDVAMRLYEATGGNPLALIELPSLLSPEQLAGAAPMSDPLPAGSSVERAFAGRADSLPATARTALLVAAVATSKEVDVVVAGLVALGLPPEALEPAEDAGLLHIVDGRLEFRHPLVRSAVHHAATASDRRAAHRALAEALVGSPRSEARAWHLAGAAIGPDEEAASALEQAAEQARRQSGYAAAAAALERAARLSPDPHGGARRLAAAADAAWRAGRPETAAALIAETLARAGDGRLRAEVLRLLGAMEFFAGKADAAASAFLEAVGLLEAVDSGGAVAGAADAVNALIRVRQPAKALETAERARSLAPQDGGETDAEATIALGYALCFAGRYGEAEPHLRRAVELFGESTALPSPLQAGRLSAALGWLGRHEQAHAYLAATVERARAAGAVGALPHLLASSSWQALHASRWNEAQADAGEALDLAEEIDQPVTAAQVLGVLTWVHALRGDDSRSRAYGHETKLRAGTLGFRLYQLLATLCMGLLDLGEGRVDEAIDQIEAVARYADERGLYIPGVSPQLELAEAYVRAGRTADAEAVLASFGSSELVSAPLPSALAERCRGLLAEAGAVDEHFEEALALHERVESPFAVARTRLCYGERLRRAGRRVEAREQLRRALETFERIGARPWAERARAELRASGETLRRQEPFEAEQLTPQELQIALQVAEGKTNKEVGAALFLSHKTVEFHLSRIYRKLDIHSRAELIRQFATEPALAPAT